MPRGDISVYVFLAGIDVDTGALWPMRYRNPGEAAGEHFTREKIVKFFTFSETSRVVSIVCYLRASDRCI